MRRIHLFIILCVLVSLSVPVNLEGNSTAHRTQSSVVQPDPCPQQLTYRIGYIDPQIEQTEKQLRQILQKVEQLWETALDEDLLEYSINGKVAIHFVYNDRQNLSDQQLKFTERIRRTKHRILGMRQEYSRVSSQYRKQKDLLLEKVSRLDSLHHQSSADNSQSNAGNRISRPSSSVRSLGDSISVLKSSVDRYRREMERKSERIQSLLRQQERIIFKYNRKFEESAQFKRGTYNEGWPDDRIYIFQYANRGELKAVLAHELGHAIGIGHVNNPQSIMYDVLEEQNIYDLTLTEEDKKAAEALCD